MWTVGQGLGFSRFKVNLPYINSKQSPVSQTLIFNNKYTYYIIIYNYFSQGTGMGIIRIWIILIPNWFCSIWFTNKHWSLSLRNRILETNLNITFVTLMFWYSMRNTSCSYHLFHNKTPLWLPAWPYLFPKSGDIIHSVDNGLHQFTVNMVINTVKLNHSLVTNHRGTQNTVRGEWGASFFSFFFLTLPLFYSLCASDTPCSCPFETVCSVKWKTGEMK